MTKPPLCLNMIVKNEDARIERALLSALPFVKAVAILDTGSTDNTVDKIIETCTKHDVQCYVEIGRFENFSQARNDAFAVAQKQCGTYLPACQFALMMDADMELVVEDPNVFLGLDANAASYDMMQTGAALTYGNRRLVNLNWKKPPYVGVTHEYIDVPAAAMIKGARFIDHADGSNRADKYDRDAALLEEDLKRDPNNARSHYYLANTYRDGNKFAQALPHYTRRIELGGWDEEVHSAMMHRADCYLKLGNEAAFVAGLIEAYNFRPSRAEPLYTLARHYREKPGSQHAAMLFSKPGLDIPRPNDVLFINDFVYSHGLRYEHSIVGSYADAERPRALELTNALALDPTCPAGVRWSARNNLNWHTVPLSQLAPSFEAHRIVFDAPDGYTPMNPSVESVGGIVTCNVRCVNYRIDNDGRYVINGSRDPHTPIDTRNFVGKLDAVGGFHFAREIVWERPAPAFPLVTGLEDVRLFRYHGSLHIQACVRELLAHGTPQQVIGRLVHEIAGDRYSVHGLKAISDGSQCEKNWMHLDEKSFVYRIGQRVIDGFGDAFDVTSPIYGGDLSGSSQMLPFKGGWLCVVHEAYNDNYAKRTYWHRFAWIGPDYKLRRVSLPFYFSARQIEFCAGLCEGFTPDELLLSFGIRDAEAWVGSISVNDVARMLDNCHEG